MQSDPVISGIPDDSYLLTVADERGCIVSKQVNITSPEKINISILTKDDIKCFGTSAGRIVVDATGGLEPYSYKLNTGEFFPSSVFNNLSNGEYTFTVKDQNNCTQQISSEINQLYDEIKIVLNKEDVRCFDEKNGRITSLITGGSGSFDLNWEQKINDVWQSEQSGLNEISLIGTGLYRLNVTDKIGCPAISESISIFQPEKALEINLLTIHDIRCYGESGRIEINAGGGNGGYNYFYSKNNGPKHLFSSGTSLSAGLYKISVSDIKGCETTWSEETEITQPLQQLDFSFIAKDYNGFNVSCFGNNDGVIDVTPLGGNGGPYTGYSYKISGREAQTLSTFTSLAAGNYNLDVTDQRGCMVSRPVTLSQDKSKIKLEVAIIEMPVCWYDTSGDIELNASGGLSPYSYCINSNAFKSDNRFSELGADKYHFTVKDRNGCLQSIDTTVSSSISKMEITGRVKDVNCFGQNDGSVKVTVEGGREPYSFRWAELTSAESEIRGLMKGMYNLSITDDAGCKVDGRYEVKEPSLPLSISAETFSACAQTPSGIIIPNAIGGKSPYSFAIGDGSEMSSDGKFYVYGGAYKVHVADANNCTTETNVNVPVRNVMPMVNFMVATSRYAMDTLVVKDVSLPRPDSIKWTFSPEALVIDNDYLQSRVKYNETGLYPVKMTGYFEQCEYSVEKLLQIAPFDPRTLQDNDNLSGIESVIISPNPNSGQFNLVVKLHTKEQINIKVLDMNSILCYSNRVPPILELEEYISLPDPMTGTYVLWVITETDSKAILFIVTP